jgi:hypothetical protein
MLIFASGCHKKSAELSSEQSHTDKAFGIAEGMKMFYGNYNAKTQTSVASLPREKSSFPAAGDEQMTVRTFFNAFSGDAGTQSFVLVTYAVPTTGQTFDCHACAPTIGMAIFSQKGLKWTVDASSSAITSSGGWGKPPTDIQLVQIGPNRRAVKFIDVGGGQGQTTAVLQFLIPWNGTVTLGLERIIADDDGGACNPDQGLPCYANHRTVTFIPIDKAEYDDVELELTGTDFTGTEVTSTRVREVRGLEILKFENGKYVQVSRQGDLTTVDRVVAEREGLK